MDEGGEEGGTRERGGAYGAEGGNEFLLRAGWGCE